MADESAAKPEEAPGRAKRYSRSKLVVGALKLALVFAFVLLLLLSGASLWLRGLVRNVTDNYYLQLTGYLLAFLAGYHLLLLGLDYYGDIVLERRYDLSNQSTAGWLARSAKEWLLSALLVVVGFNLLYRLIRGMPNQWWLFAAVGWFLLLVLIGKITPAVIVPLFYRLHPLTDRNLADRLLALAERCGVQVGQVLEIKLSKETKKANAAVVGLGQERKILIGDTLLDLCAHDEIEAVFAHELGHVALHHSWKLLGVAGAASVVAFYVLHLFYARSAAYLGFEGAADIAAVPLLMLWAMVLGLIARPFQAALSRHFERRADLFIVGRVEKPESLASALAKLAGRNLADPNPNRLVELLFYTHPPIAKRLAYLEQSTADTGSSGCR
jgi:STE24 endopeptidase